VDETLESAQVRAAMVSAATEVVQTRFSPQPMAAAYFAVYERLARKNSGLQGQEGY
jgi:hypothetical protein